MANILRKQGKEIGGCDTSNVEKNIEAIVNVYGAKNLLPYPYYETTKEVNGITFTDNGDGTITVSGTATSDARFDVHTESTVDKPMLEGQYIMTGCPLNGGANTYSLKLQYRTNDNLGWVLPDYTDYGEGVTFNSDGLHTRWIVYILIKSGTTINNLTFRPMIRDARIMDDTWTPYAMTNRELTDRVNSRTIVNIEEYYTFQSADTWEYTGVSVVIPAGKRYSLMAYNLYNNIAPKGIVFSTTNKFSDFNQYNRGPEGFNFTSICGIGGTQDSTFYVYAKVATGGYQNRILITGWYE